MDYSSLGKKLTSKTLAHASCFVGFDGFTDEIISVVDKAINTHVKSFIPTIKDFGTKIINSSHKSCNFELVTIQKKLGGNAPIFTNALLEGGHSIVFAGAIGASDQIEPLFQSMADRCKKVFPLAESSKTDALEFQDGKIILGKMDSLKDITYKNLLKQIDEKDLTKLLDETDLLVTVNWTMIAFTTDFWKVLLEKIAPKLSKREKKRVIFVDLADPAKRTHEDLLEALDILSKLNKFYDVILGLNTAEAEILCHLFKINSENMEELAFKLFKKLGLARVIIHHATFALLKDETDYIYLKSLHTKAPKLTTGAGDNFNAGYCNGLLYGFSKTEALMTAIATSGFYVRHGFSPSMQELHDWLQTFIQHDV